MVILTQEVERFCSPNILTDSCASRRKVKELIACPITYTISASPNTTSPRGLVIVNWSASHNRPTSDWVGLYTPSSGNGSYISYKYISGGRAGSLTFTIPSTVGTYEFRYFNYRYNLVTTSNTVTVANPSPTPTPDPGDGGCDEFIVCWGETQFNPITCHCEPTSPIIIDTSGNGYNLTSGANGVLFDFDGDGDTEKFAWTSANSDDSFLVLDRNNNGTIDNGRELFGNFTPQLPTNEPNGFLALAEFDKPAKGGNNDGEIDSHDTVFQFLRLWRDTNHNGISEANELFTLRYMDIVTIELDYKESRRIDEHGNRFKYRSKVKDARGAQVGRWAWDIFFVVP